MTETPARKKRQLTPPSQELAARLRDEVPLSKSLGGIKMSLMGGSNPTTLSSLGAAASFLKAGTVEEAMAPNSQSTLGYIELNALSIWVREVLLDEELADAILEEIADDEPWGFQAPRVKELLMQRALQIVGVFQPTPEDVGPHRPEGSGEPEATEAAG